MAASDKAQKVATTQYLLATNHLKFKPMEPQFSRFLKSANQTNKKGTQW